ncbi:MAG: GNAT family N-acetyltransferase [Akkermansiaceae bacterium]|nr:GNAT family N-acetyltransferase [Akkermansiaceae bacterium]
MFWCFTRWFAESVLGKVVDRVIKEPASADYVMAEEREIEEEPGRWMAGAIGKESFREFVAELDGALERSFRPGQLNTLMGKVSNLGKGESLSLFFSVSYRGQETALQLAAEGEENSIYVRMEGVGPVMELVAVKFGPRIQATVELARLEEVTVGSPRYEDLLRLRFLELRMPLGLRWTVDDLKWEQVERHFGLYLLDQPVAVVAVRELSEGEVKLRQIATAKAFQGKGYGRRLMELIEGQLAGERVRTCELHSRMNIADFYEKLGYERVGEVFEEIGLPHVKMRKELRPLGILKETNEKLVGR